MDFTSFHFSSLVSSCVCQIINWYNSWLLQALAPPTDLQPPSILSPAGRIPPPHAPCHTTYYSLCMTIEAGAFLSHNVFLMQSRLSFHFSSNYFLNNCILSVCLSLYFDKNHFILKHSDTHVAARNTLVQTMGQYQATIIAALSWMLSHICYTLLKPPYYHFPLR